jgi:hypothetical protein
MEQKMESKFGVVKVVNGLIEANHIVVYGTPLFVNCQRARRVVTDGIQILAFSSYDAILPISETCETIAWLYDLTDGKVVYGDLPASNCFNKSSPCQDTQ